MSYLIVFLSSSLLSSYLYYYENDNPIIQVQYIDALIQHVERGDIQLDDIITHRLPLAEAPHGYSIFNQKEDNCVKVVLQP